MNEVRGKLITKSFTDKDGVSHEYYCISIPLVTGDSLDLPLKKEKAQMLLMSLKLENE